MASATLTPEQKRTMMQSLAEAVARLPPPPDSLEEFEVLIPVQDEWSSRTKIVRPKARTTGKRPLIVHFFGGGFLIGEPEHLLHVARAFAETYDAIVALPSYRLVPDVRWPVPFHDGWHILAWLSEHAEQFGADLDAGFIVGGSSAGGSLAAVCSGLYMFPDLKEAQEVPRLAKPLTGQFLCVPWLLMDENLPAEYKSLFTSQQENANVAGFNAAGLKLVCDNLQCTDYKSPWFSPVTTIASDQQHLVNKIPAYMDHCGLDPFRDDVTIYGKLLESRGVQTMIRLFPEDVHGDWDIVDHPSKAKNPKIPEAQMEGMKWLLSHSLKGE